MPRRVHRTCSFVDRRPPETELEGHRLRERLVLQTFALLIGDLFVELHAVAVETGRCAGILGGDGGTTGVGRAVRHRREQAVLERDLLRAVARGGRVRDVRGSGPLLRGDAVEGAFDTRAYAIGEELHAGTPEGETASASPSWGSTSFLPTARPWRPALRCPFVWLIVPVELEVENPYG